MFIIEGGPTCYGKAEPWKYVFEEISQTKCSQAKKNAKNNGRPPDTAHKLLSAGQQTKKSAKQRSKKDINQLCSYQWAGILAIWTHPSKWCFRPSCVIISHSQNLSQVFHWILAWVSFIECLNIVKALMWIPLIFLNHW